MLGLNKPGGGGRVLTLDIENRPISYWTPDRPTADITAIASCWSDDPDSMEVLLLGRMTQRDMLRKFVARYMTADLVTGHYIRGHDLPIINGALLEHGLPTLSPKMSSDTRLDLIKKGDIPATQEFLLDTLGIDVPKYHMTQTNWRAANRLTSEGIAQAEKRVTDDVLGHMALRKEMQKRGLLGPPRMWNPGGTGTGRYTG